MKTHKAALNTTKKKLLAQSISVILACSVSGHFSYAQEIDAQEQDKPIFEVIEVTSQKRVQNVMQVPITVGIVSSDLLDKSASISLSDVDKFIPGFEFSDGNVTQAGVTIRGISSPNISSGGDPSSATFFDDIYMPRAAQNVIFSDIERIEVLKGPQGTLFGRNASMGVVSIIPKKPTDFSEGFAKFSWGTDMLARYEAMANVALSDNVFLRTNALISKQNGMVTNLSEPDWNDHNKIWDIGAKNHKAARLALLWQASNDTNVQFSLDLDRLNQAPPMAIGLSDYAYNGGNDIFSKYAENDVREGVEKRDMYALTTKVEHEFNGNWSMKYVASFRDWETVNREDEDGTGDITRYFDTSNNEDSDIFYTELQFNYVSDKISAVTGFSYSKENVKQTTELNLTTDTIARKVTQELNNDIRSSVAAEIADLIGGTSDEAAAAAFGPGATFDYIVNLNFNQMGLPIDHIWNSEQWAGALNALGFGPTITDAIGLPGADLTGNIVELTGDVTYDAVAQQLGIPEIFGPSHRGQFWQESVNNTGDFTNWGVFADIDYAITDKWHVIAGLRYSNDQKDFTWTIPENSFASIRPGVANQIFPQVDLAASDEWSKVTGRLVTNYQINDDTFVFASYSSGYKSGGFDSLAPISQSAGQAAFAPEDSKNLEIGYKAYVFKHLMANISYYQTTIDNFQVAVESKQPDSSNSVSTIINQNRSFDGLELTLNWSVTDSLSAGFLTDIRKTQVESPAFYDSSGELLEPENNEFDADTDYTFTLDWVTDIEYGDINLHLDYVFEENTNDQRPDIQDYEMAIPEYLADKKLLNARLSFVKNDDLFEIAFWARNIMNERYVEGISNITAELLGTPHARINRGKEIGMDFKYNF